MSVSRDDLRTNDSLRLSASTHGAGAVRAIVPNGAYYARDLAPLWSRRAALVYDLRNRGASDAATDVATLSRGIWNDVDDLESVRCQLDVDRVDLVAHSYVAAVAVLYAVAHPSRVGRVVLIGPGGHGIGHKAPPSPDAAVRGVFARLGGLQFAADASPKERCEAFWRVLAELYVVDPVHVGVVAGWGRCDCANERAFMAYWTTYIEPSLKALTLADADLARVSCPVLVVHGARDRSADYAGGRAWARRLLDARLLTVPEAAHAPWLEAPDLVIPAIDAFLRGTWPAAAERVPPTN